MALVDNLLDYWQLDNDRLAEVSLNMSVVGTDPGFTTGVINQGLNFPGVSGRYSTFTYNSAVSAGTIAFWYKSTGNGTGTFHRIISKTQVGLSDVIVIALNNNGKRPSLVIHDVSIISEASDVLTQNVWYHHVITWNGTVAKWYINGSESYSVSTTQTVASNTTAYAVGGWGGNSTQQPQGVIDEIGYWLRAITATEASQLYNSGAGYPYPFVSLVKAHSLFFNLVEKA